MVCWLSDPEAILNPCQFSWLADDYRYSKLLGGGSILEADGFVENSDAEHLLGLRTSGSRKISNSRSVSQ
jgi:hypothetical protein